MKSLLLSLCLIAAAVAALTTPNPARVANVEADDPMGAAIPSSVNCIPSTQIAVAQADQYEVHAVGVHDRMPVMLLPEDYDTWLGPNKSPDELRALLRPHLRPQGEEFRRPYARLGARSPAPRRFRVGLCPAGWSSQP